AVDRRPADRPLGDPAVAADEVIVGPVVHVRNPLEPGGEPPPNLLLADEAAPPRVRAAWGVEDAVIGERGHDRVEVVSVESGEHIPKNVQPLALTTHRAPPRPRAMQLRGPSPSRYRTSSARSSRTPHCRQPSFRFSASCSRRASESARGASPRASSG